MVSNIHSDNEITFVSLLLWGTSSFDHFIGFPRETNRHALSLSLSSSLFFLFLDDFFFYSLLSDSYLLSYGMDCDVSSNVCVVLIRNSQLATKQKKNIYKNSITVHSYKLYSYEAIVSGWMMSSPFDWKIETLWLSFEFELYYKCFLF